MWFRVLLFSVLCAGLVLSAVPEPSHAKDRQTAKSKKKKKSSKRKGAKKTKSPSTDDATSAQGGEAKADPNPYAAGDGENSGGEDDEPRGVLTEGTTGEGALRRSTEWSLTSAW